MAHVVVELEVEVGGSSPEASVIVVVPAKTVLVEWRVVVLVVSLALFLFETSAV